MAKKLLAIDIGNTNIVLGAFNLGQNDKSLCLSYRFPTKFNTTSDELGSKIEWVFAREKIDNSEISAVVISSVVPQLDELIKKTVSRYLDCECMFINGSMDIGMKILYDRPYEIGADRIVNAISAMERYGAPVLVVDFGTAITIDTISKERAYCGGIIFQGVELSIDALSKKASKLPKISMKEPLDIIGKTTEQSIQSGIYYSFLGGIGYIVDKIKKRKEFEGAKVIATGGYATLYQKESTVFDAFDEELTLNGLKIIYNKITTEFKKGL